MRRCCGAPSSQAKLQLEKTARLFAETGMHAEAIQVLIERARLSPQNPMIWNDLGVEYMAAGQPDSAHEAFERAHEAFPDYPLPLYNLGRLAVRRYLEVQAGQPSSPELSRRFAVEAIGYLSESLSRDPFLCEAHLLLATAYEAIGDEVRAKLHMQAASTLNPERLREPESVLLKRASKPIIQAALPFILSSGKHLNVGKF